MRDTEADRLSNIAILCTKQEQIGVDNDVSLLDKMLQYVVYWVYV